jgi:type VI secretion system protein ImpH
VAGQERATTGPLVNELLQAPRRFSFYQAVRLLERTLPDAVSIGHSGPIEREAVRLRPNPTMGFASSDIEDIEPIQAERGADGETWSGYRITVNFLGLYGAGSPLPAFYTEDIVMRDEEAENRRQFFDLFHHRYLSFAYRTTEKYRYYLRYRQGAKDQFSLWLRGLIGLRGDAGRNGAPVEHPEKLLSSIGLLLQHSRSAATLSRILSHYFDGLPVTIEQFIPRQVSIEPAQRAFLGQANCTLGLDCSPGETVPDTCGKFRIRIGPLDFAAFRELLPDGADHRRLSKVVPFLLRDQLAHDLELILHEEAVPPLELGGECPARLGWSTWLGTYPGGDGRVVLDA